MKGKPIAFLAFDYTINLKKDQEMLNFLILKLSMRLKESYQDRLQFAIIELPNFPHIKRHLKLSDNARKLHFFI